jgi:hypothetical protein
VLFPTDTTLFDKSSAVATELQLSDSRTISSFSRSVFFDLVDKNENLSAKVVWLQSGLLQYIFRLSIIKITFFPCIGKS